MDNLLDVIQADTEPDIDPMDANYQANKFTLEEALREAGAIKPLFAYVKSPYDADIMRLINAVPMR